MRLRSHSSRMRSGNIAASVRLVAMPTNPTRPIDGPQFASRPRCSRRDGRRSILAAHINRPGRQRNSTGLPHGWSGNRPTPFAVGSKMLAGKRSRSFVAQFGTGDRHSADPNPDSSCRDVVGLGLIRWDMSGHHRSPSLSLSARPLTRPDVPATAGGQADDQPWRATSNLARSRALVSLV
jgi:hypothetical protein